jgi:uncharacterized MAPEG superfamily protein
LMCSGIYRWSLILTGRASISEWRADMLQGSPWYQRAMRAHMNCIENLPVYTAITVVLVGTGITSDLIDMLCVTLLVARVCQTLVHIGPAQTNTVVAIRFTFFAVQAIAMISIGIAIIARLSM